MKFHTSRPESFAIYKRTYASGPWEPYQYYSASCQKTYGRPEGHYLRPGEDERVAFCTSEFSDISPLNGGNVAFSTLEGRPSAYNFEESPVLQVRGQLNLGRRVAGWDVGQGTASKSAELGPERPSGCHTFNPRILPSFVDTWLTFIFKCNSFMYLIFQERISLCSPSFPRTHSMDQGWSRTQGDLPASAS